MATSKQGFSLTQLLHSGAYSDFVLSCQGQEIKVHKAVVCSQSPVLAAAADGSFKVGEHEKIQNLGYDGRLKRSYQEAQTGVIKIEESEPETMKQMIEYLYTGDYNIQSPPQVEESMIQNSSTEIISQHVKVNAIADFYQIKELSELSNAKILETCTSAWDPQAFVMATKEALSITGDSALHDMLATIASEHFGELSNLSGFGEMGHEFDNAVLRCRVQSLEAEGEKLRLLLQDIQGWLDKETEKRQAAEAREQAFKSRVSTSSSSYRDRNRWWLQNTHTGGSRSHGAR